MSPRELAELAPLLTAWNAAVEAARVAYDVQPIATCHRQWCAHPRCRRAAVAYGHCATHHRARTRVSAVAADHPSPAERLAEG